MRNGKARIDNVLRREFVRLVLERVQGASLEMAVTGMEFDPDNIPGAQYEVTEYLNRPYMNKSEVALAMDVFMPKAKEDEELPVIVNIHGGGLVLGDRKMSRAYGHVLASRGYIVFNIEYRLAPRANVAEQMDDVCAGMDAIGSHLMDFEVDFGRIFLTADSAGAYLAIYTAAMKRSKRLQKVIGYEPTRMDFRAIGLVSGMFYTTLNDPLGFLLADQFYGNKATSPEFLELMNPEHHEILLNLPPVFLVTSRGDFLNNYSIMYHKALKAAGKTTKLVYYGDANLGHTFVTGEPTHPKSIDAIDRMLAWFEEQAAARIKKFTLTDEQKEKIAHVEERMENHKIIEQKSWSFIREQNSVSDERLDAVAMRDNRRAYTYRQMFRKWERYAEVYSALGIGKASGSRVGVLGTTALEPTFAFYGLNMVGASVSMISPMDLVDVAGIFKNVEHEKVTDLIISDLFAEPSFVNRMLVERERLGLRNVIIMKSPYGGPLGNDALEAFSIQNYLALKRKPGLLFMDDLLREYEGTPIAYANDATDEAAVILHTSGTTNGVHKPVPHSDRSLNEAAYRLMRSEFAEGVGVDSVCLLNLDLSASYAMCDMLHLSLALGAQVATIPFAITNPNAYKAVAHYGASCIFLSPFMVVDLIEKAGPQLDLSSVKMLILGGEYLSADTRQRLNKLLRKRGSEARVVNGYGLSEAGAAVIISGPDCDDDTIGYPLPGVEVRILDEEDGTYHELSEGPRRGVLMLKTISLSSGRLDDVEYFSLEEIDGERWLNTYDLVDVNEDGSLTYVGRMNKFFVNNEGIRFDAGLVETAVAKQSGIVATGLAAEYDKFIHDTVPVLYVTCTTQGRQAVRTLHDALVGAFVREDNISQTNLPGQCVVCADIPHTTTGKVDVHQIMAGTVEGDRYKVIPVYVGKKLADVRLVPAVAGPGTWAGMPQELDPRQRRWTQQ